VQIDSHYSVEQGLVTLGPVALELKRLLESHFLQWAAEVGAVELAFPPLVPVADLARLDYFTNFPHLALIATRLKEEALPDFSHGQHGHVEEFEGSHLTAGRYALPSAACYNIYLHLRDTVLEEPRYVTVVANCFRNEKEYNGLQRLLGFTMREIVCVGPLEAVQAHLSSFKERLRLWLAGLGVPIAIQAATDPFYESQGARALQQRLFPVKEEFVYGGSLAISSVNFHRNFFGEKCGIRTATGEPAYSGCVAFGLERWLHALLDHFQGDVAGILQAIHHTSSAEQGVHGHA
jgi:seryl-tRNA synthetase